MDGEANSKAQPSTRCTEPRLLLGHAELESTVRYLGIEVDDALAITEQMEL
jgi:hypothetical protein